MGYKCRHQKSKCFYWIIFTRNKDKRLSAKVWNLSAVSSQRRLCSKNQCVIHLYQPVNILKCPEARLRIPPLHAHTYISHSLTQSHTSHWRENWKFSTKKCFECNEMLKSSKSFGGWTCLGEAAPNWCLHRRPLFSRWTFYYSGRKDGKNIKTKTQCWHSSAALWTEGEMSKQSPGAGVFWWTKLPARRLHVGQVNKAQRRWCGGFDRVRLWNLWLCFHRLAAMLICKWHARYSRLDNFCPATLSLIFLHKRSCVIQSKHHILRKKKKMTGMCARNVTPNRPQKGQSPSFTSSIASLFTACKVHTL